MPACEGNETFFENDTNFSNVNKKPPNDIIHSKRAHRVLSYNIIYFTIDLVFFISICLIFPLGHGPNYNKIKEERKHKHKHT